MTTTWLLLVLIASYQIVGIQSTSHDETCEDEGLLGAMATNLKSILEQQRSQLEEGEQQLRALLERIDDMERELAAVRPRDCADLFKCGERENGVYTVYPGSGCVKKPVQVYCDMTTAGGGWTVFQRRKDGSVDFYRNWQDYKNGFGNFTGEFWLGNEALHLITSSRRHRLRIQMENFEGQRERRTKYDDFRIGSEAEKYRLASVGGYVGTAGDCFTEHVGENFSTKDSDNDSNPDGSCATTYSGAWWYGNCGVSCLNGLYLEGRVEDSDRGKGVMWSCWMDYNYSLKKSEMKTRPYDF